MKSSGRGVKCGPEAPYTPALVQARRFTSSSPARMNSEARMHAVAASYFTQALGPMVVTASEDGTLQLNPPALSAQLHGRYDKGTRCHCPRCKDTRRPRKAGASPVQPWETRRAA